MAIALVGTPVNTTWGATAATKQIAMNGAATTTVGNKLIAICFFGGSVSAITCSDNSTQAGTANTWTEVATVFINSTVGVTVWWADCTRPMLTSDRATFNWTSSVPQSASGSEWSGMVSGAQAATITNSGTGTSQNTGALSAATAGDLVLGLFVYGTAIAYTAGADGQGNTMTVLHQPTPANGRSSLVEYLVEASALAYTPAATVASGTSNWAARALRFNAAIAAPVNSLAPAVTGTTTVGSTLSCTTGTWSGSPTYAYQWKDAGGNIASATSATYVIGSGENGASIHCDVTATNGGGSNTASSNTVGPITGVPVNTVAPALSGNKYTGQVLTCSTGTWSNTPTLPYTYQWKKDGSNIGGATSSTYTLLAGDATHAITCAVVASNASGAGTPATSNSVTAGTKYTATMNNATIEVCANAMIATFSSGDSTATAALFATGGLLLLLMNE